MNTSVSAERARSDSSSNPSDLVVVVGGGTTGIADGFGSVGIDVTAGAAPEIKDSDIRGGAGISQTSCRSDRSFLRTSRVVSGVCRSRILSRCVAWDREIEFLKLARCFR